MNRELTGNRPVAIEKAAFEKDGKFVLDRALTEDPYPTWKKLEELVEKGKIRNIGVSK
jgi:diketogulonate reductase-like aldo/keto reductase